MYQKGNKILDVLGLFLGDYKSQLYLREISKTAKIPLKTTQNTLSYMEKNKILKSNISGKNKYFKLNLENVHTKLLLMQAEIQKTESFIDYYPLFKTFIKEIKTIAPLIIFGSFARLQANKNSDVDLLILSREKQKLPVHLLSYKLHQISVPEKAFIKSLEKQEPLIKEIQSNHLILNNHSFYINAMWNYYGNK